MNITILFSSLLLGILPALLWLRFWLKEDNLNPEPRSLITISFIAGIISVIAAIILERYIANITSNIINRYIIWAAIEELVKFTAVMIVALSSRNMDEPIDAMIYCITVALGFSAIENTLFVFAPIQLGEFARGIVTSNMRFVGATLVHIVSSASIGFMYGISFYKSKIIKIISIIAGIILSVTLHASFNLSIINSSAIDTLKVFGWVWIAVVILMILFEEIKIIKPKNIIISSQDK